jgi:hypothetical protein
MIMARASRMPCLLCLAVLLAVADALTDKVRPQLPASSVHTQ